MTATFRLYEELNDALPQGRRKAPFPVRVRPGDTVQTCLRRLGVAPCAVDLVLVDGCPAGLDHPVADGSRVSVYPVFESFDISPVTRLPARPLRRLAFAVVPELGALAGELRRAGVEAEVLADAGPACLARAAARGRVLLTRDAPAGLPRVYRVQATDLAAQAAEVCRRFQLGLGRAVADRRDP